MHLPIDLLTRYLSLDIVQTPIPQTMLDLPTGLATAHDTTSTLLAREDVTPNQFREYTSGISSR